MKRPLGYEYRCAYELSSEFLYSDSQDVIPLLEYAGIPRVYWQDITAVIVTTTNEIWLTENGDWYNIFATFQPVSYYTSV